MIGIILDNERVIISITGWDRVFCLKGRVSFAKSNIIRAYPYEKSITPPWLKNPGTAIPGVIIAGTYQNLKERKEFWCTHFNGNTIVIDLEGEKYNRVVLDLPQDEPVDHWIEKLAV